MKFEYKNKNGVSLPLKATDSTRSFFEIVDEMLKEVRKVILSNCSVQIVENADELQIKITLNEDIKERIDAIMNDYFFSLTLR